MLGNFWFVGFIHLMLPAARVVHTVRHPMATGLSIFQVLRRFGE